MKNEVRELQVFAREELELVRRELRAKPGEQWISHQFFGPDGAKSDSTEEKAYLSILVPALRKLGLEVDIFGGPLGVEAWERAHMSETWSDQAVAAMCVIGDKASCEYQGWAWESAGRPGYFTRLKPGVVGVAVGLTTLFAVEFAFSWFSGDVKGGTSSNIALRLVGVTVFIAVASFMLSALYDWQERRKY